MWPRQEDRCRSDIPRKTHPPQMPRDTLNAEDTAAYEYANVSRRSNQRHGTKERVRPHRISILQPSRTMRRLKPKRHIGNSHRQHNQQRAPIKNLHLPLPAPCNPPSRRHQVERESAAQDIARLMLQSRHIHPARSQSEHRHDKYVSSHAMPAGTLPERYRDGTRQQT